MSGLADRPDSVSVPEEAIERAREAAMRTGSTKASVVAAAPLIVAAELERLADDLPRDLGVLLVDGEEPSDVESMPTYDEGVDDMQTALRRRASVLRGEGQTDA